MTDITEIGNYRIITNRLEPKLDCAEPLEQAGLEDLEVALEQTTTYK